MAQNDEEEKLLRSVALQNASAPSCRHGTVPLGENSRNAAAFDPSAKKC